MNDHHKTFIAFVKLGHFLREFVTLETPNDEWSRKLDEAIVLSKHKNGWFTRENVIHALKSWGELLTDENLTAWLSAYDVKQNRPKTVALIMAGNIPLVGFHDFLSVLITGNKVLAKLSSNDNVLNIFIKDYLVSIEPSLKDSIEISDGRLEGFDAVIATGSNNTSRYFEHYFSKVPNIIRKNRNSVAVLTGNESTEQLNALGEDVFRYYGLGCRSVSKIFVPDTYDFDTLFKAVYPHHPIVEHVKYANNYDYNKAVYLMSEFKILDNGFLILKEDKSYSSPIASLFYERYKDLSSLKERLASDTNELQCIVGQGVVEGEIPFGKTQQPSLTDYADNLDTVDFLLKN
ncbi:acyl-CoA reductase [Zobellia galactanivorans]|uniref:acyl-CoA reductase n=1 Tax=Zobellia galactanivorans (strain DSM 12802 / CCUG 47099 / CIP 106680 / NCIMB 13871 / Dsij) TaxID=63186 RepID=UPI0026E221D6|nr:acyl-CoA reductase [Zobellia galactanivorans]MDO6808646.1 acyl-CoA reductase [Zobellia galactanivorans]